MQEMWLFALCKEYPIVFVECVYMSLKMKLAYLKYDSPHHCAVFSSSTLSF